MKRIKLKAGALQLVTLIGVLIALLLSAFILLLYIHKKFSVQTDFIVETVQQSHQGIAHVLYSKIPLNDTVFLERDTNDKVLKVFRAYWGVFEKVTTTASVKNKQFKKVALIGSSLLKKERTALYLQDNNKPLVLVGTTKINGTSYLPKQGVKPGNISGQSFYGQQLINGTIKSAYRLPKIAPELLDALTKINEAYLERSHNNFITTTLNETVSNSFYNQTKFIFSKSRIKLDNVELIGNIIVQSKTEIRVSASSKLKDVLLIAPKIIIEDEVTGNFQALATHEIIVGKKVTLDYPSALILKEQKNPQEDKQHHEKEHGILLDAHSSIKGLILYIGLDTPNNYKSQIKLEANSHVYGEVYCTQNLELKGNVYGSVFTNNFLTSANGTIYQNHILNGTILVDQLPQEYVGLAFDNSLKHVAQWLY